MLEEKTTSLKVKIEEVRFVLNELADEKEKIKNDEQILKVSEQLDKLIVSYMMV
ncbi:aspartyl-phosphate phosphatase Spo0E family protein [Haloimpatiens sp. FM7330]|uniref:aspartyl-phosphate phosphatase Spo0E family protein n=1 Tax=Haloimpatiens sp. FM7330 TaxID=3298610 RepID=UPI00363BDDDD